MIDIVRTVAGKVHPDHAVDAIDRCIAQVDGLIAPSIAALPA